MRKFLPVSIIPQFRMVMWAVSGCDSKVLCLTAAGAGQELLSAEEALEAAGGGGDGVGGAARVPTSREGGPGRHTPRPWDWGLYMLLSLHQVTLNSSAARPHSWWSTFARYN